MCYAHRVASFRAILQENWFDLIQTVSLMGGLLFTGLSLRRENSARRWSNLLALKQEHRELWSTIHDRPELSRILKAEVDLLAHPMTQAEEVFLHQVIVHVAVSWELIRQGTPLDLTAFRNDVGAFFNLPLPRAEWRAVRMSQKPQFVTFVETALADLKAVSTTND